MRTLILLDQGRLAYATDGAHEELAEQLRLAQEAHPSVYVFDADELIDHRSAEPEPMTAAEAARAFGELGRSALTIGSELQVTTPLEAAWEQARKAYDVPDDGIAAWSLTLRETEGGWEAEAWRSDTTTVTAVGPTGPEALQALARRAP